MTECEIEGPGVEGQALGSSLVPLQIGSELFGHREHGGIHVESCDGPAVSQPIGHGAGQNAGTACDVLPKFRPLTNIYG